MLREGRFQGRTKSKNYVPATQIAGGDSVLFKKKHTKGVEFQCSEFLF